MMAAYPVRKVADYVLPYMPFLESMTHSNALLLLDIQKRLELNDTAR